MKESLGSLTPEERAELRNCLQALEEGVSVPELLALNAALDEELQSPSPGLTVDEVRRGIQDFGRDNTAST